MIRVTGPDGKEMFERGVVLDSSKASQYSFGVPYNAEKGTYTFKITDYVTGLSTVKTVNIK